MRHRLEALSRGDAAKLQGFRSGQTGDWPVQALRAPDRSGPSTRTAPKTRLAGDVA